MNILGTHHVAVIGSDDDGGTWTTRSSFPDQSTSSGHTTPDGDGQLVGVRFATDRVGYAFGSSAFRTSDGAKRSRPSSARRPAPPSTRRN